MRQPTMPRAAKPLGRPPGNAVQKPVAKAGNGHVELPITTVLTEVEQLAAVREHLESDLPAVVEMAPGQFPATDVEPAALQLGGQAPIGSSGWDGHGQAAAAGNPYVQFTPRGASVTDLAARRKQQTRLTWRRRLKRTGSGLGAAAVTAAAVWLVGFSSYFVLTEAGITVVAEPGSLVDLEAVHNAALAHTGTPLIRLRPGQIRTAVTDQPAVKDAQVSRSWPSGVRIEVASRQPIAAVSTASGVMLIDADAVQLVPATDRGDLPLLDVPLDDALIVTSALAVFNELPPAIGAQLRHISATTIDDISTVLTTGQVIRWGSSEQLKLKAALALALLDAAPTTRYFDVSSPAVPITR